MKTLLGTAIGIAAICHHEQSDRGEKAYILHPLRMMMRLRTDDEELMCIAVLHDCIEDSELELVEASQIIEVRGEKFPVRERYSKCKTCGEEFYDPETCLDPLDEAYRKYIAPL